MTELQDLRDFLKAWRESYGEAAGVHELCEGFPNRESFVSCWDVECDRDTWEAGMLRMLDEGIVGMMGFKYCWPEVAREDFRRWHLARKAS